jgi:hypothetical protein
MSELIWGLACLYCCLSSEISEQRREIVNLTKRIDELLLKKKERRMKMDDSEE